MGCASSKIDNEEKVVRCKERKRLMRQAVSSRHEFAAAQVAYLQALRNAGATLRQFAEVESMELQRTSPYHYLHHYRVTLPPPPPPLPPPPPPPPPPPLSLTPSPSYGSATFPSSIPVHRASTDVRNSNAQPPSPPKNSTSEQQWNTPHDSDTETPTPPPPPPPPQGSAWDFWDPFCASSPTRISDRRASHTSEDELKKQQQQQQQQQTIEEELWDETVTEFDDEQESENGRLPDKSPGRETDDNSSMVSWYTKDTDLAMVVSRKHKNLGEIVRELDEYFLKASEGGKEVSKFLYASKAYLEHDFGMSKKNSYRSAKVFSALSWSRSSKSPIVCRDTVEFLNTDEPCTRGSHSSTLERLHAWEKRLYEKVRSGESAKICYEKKLALLRSQESKGHEEAKINKTKTTIEMLQSEILAVHQDVTEISASILNLKENELYPQLVELSEGLMRMWRSMYDCHLVQNHIVQQVNHLDSLPSTEGTSDYHRKATSQLETEVTAWYKSFCTLIKSQRNYMQSLDAWMKLSLYQLEYGIEGSLEPCPFIPALVDEWQQALDRLPDKAASEAIKSFVTIVHEMVVKQGEEQKHRRKSERLSKRLEKKLASLQSLERKYNASTTDKSKETPNSGLDPKDPLAQKRAKIDAFKRKVEDEKSKHLNSIRITRAMTLKNLQTGLPNVFQAMTSFSSACMQEYEAVHNQSKSFRF